MGNGEIEKLRAALAHRERGRGKRYTPNLKQRIAYSGVIWAPIPEAPGQGFGNDAGANSGSTWALIPA